MKQKKKQPTAAAKKNVRVAKRSNIFSLVTPIVLALAIVVNLLVYVITAAFGLYLYSPSTYDLSLSGYTRILFEEAEAESIKHGEKVKIIFCQSPDELQNNSKGSVVHETAKKFRELHPDFIEIQYLNLITKVLTRGDNSTEYVDLADYQPIIDEASVDNEAQLTAARRLLKSSVIFMSDYGRKVLTDSYSTEGYSSFYTVNSSGYAVAYNGEEIIASMIMWTLPRDNKPKEHKTAYFTVYHGEVSDVAFSNLLVCAGYNIDTIDLVKEEIPENAGLVVISSPTKDFERGQEGSDISSEIEKLREYVKGGGNIYVALDPYAEKLPELEKLLEEFGIAMSYANIAGKPEDVRNFVRDANDSIEADFFTMEVSFATGGAADAIYETVKQYSQNKVLIKDCSALELSKQAQPLLKTSAAATLYAAGQQTDGAGSYCVAAVSRALDEKGNPSGSVFVVPSVYLTASDGMVSGGYANRTFIYSVFENIHGLEDLPYGCKSIYYSDYILEGLTMRVARMYTVAIIAVPVVIALVGGVVIIRRKNR